MEEAAKALDSFGISYSADVVSAHRMPEEMVEFAKSAASKGFKVIIAGAGGAAHLPGMVASLTTLPVIGVPVSLKNLDGMDSLLSIVQMPGGVPVATVGIDSAKNAGILAARIIGSADATVAKKIEAQLSELTVEAKAKGAQLSARRNGKTGF
jgi:5-(carboxyamino)imidazole ribonucleotide mutase